MVCNFCKSENLYMKEADSKTGLFCKSCGRWLKWVTPDEKAVIQRQIDRQKREIRIDGQDVERVIEKYKGYKQKYKALNDEIAFLRDSIGKNSSEIEKSAMMARVLKLKELTTMIAAYDEILLALGLRK